MLTAEFKPATKDVVWEKMAFFFSDNHDMNESDMNAGVSRWVQDVDGQYYFLPPRSRRYSITHLFRLALPK